MKKILFISLPISGHVNPQSNLCKELAEKDVELVYYTLEKYFDKFKGIDNIKLRKYPDSFLTYYNQLANDESIQSQFMALIYVFYTFTENLLPFIMEEVSREKPDLIICDTFALWGKVAARYYKIPYAYFYSSFMGDSIVMKKSPAMVRELIKSAITAFPYVLKFNSIIKRVEKKYGKVIDKPYKVMSHQGKFTMVVTSKEFHPGGNEYPDTVNFIGPAHIDRGVIPANKNTIFISLGTICFSDTFWDTCIEASKDLGYNVVVSFGGNTNNKVDPKNLQDNVKMYDNLSLEEYRNVLKQSVLFISHGGFNSISDSILYKTPLIVCPRQAEQITNGKLVQQYGCGILFRATKNVESAALRKKIVEVIANENIKVNLEKYRQSFLNSIGFKNIVDKLNKEFDLF
ncbi:glycosyltransferase [Clostridium estertheticum]|uniref:glycosyltransferase n=1 Tax=Clostridium estertheticum TaxID=238834 RepID=UPI001C7DC81F|nr:glycosyltransferase [Clostridium estertheticum]MBX4266843.1 glycosyl transferase [Clostridium estertheticum]WLC89027.1 glycosyl transferase [Clostridium estertheticum]